MFKPVEVIEVKAWGMLVGVVVRDPGSGYYVFEFTQKWRQNGVELAPLQMPLAYTLYVFPILNEQTFQRLPAMLADSLPDRFGNALITAYLAQKGVAPASITPLDRLAYMASRGMGALEFKPAKGPGTTKSTAM